MQQAIIEDTLARLKHMLEQEDWDGASDLIETLRPADQAHLFSELVPEQQDALLPQLELEDAADILEKLDDPEAAALAQRVPADTLASIADRMEPDEAADLLDDLPDVHAADTLAVMESAEEIRPLMPYPDNTAGGLMTTDFIALRRRATVAQAVDQVRQWALDSDLVNYLFVVDGDGVLCGVTPLRRLVFTEPDLLVETMMEPDIIYVTADVDQEECARLISHYDLLALPVVDVNQRLLGVVTVDDVVDVLVDEATEDIHRMGATEPLEERYLSASLFTMARKRGTWLLLLFAAETLTGSVLRHFEVELATVVALAFFVPLLIGTGGQRRIPGSNHGYPGHGSWRNTVSGSWKSAEQRDPTGHRIGFVYRCCGVRPRVDLGYCPISCPDCSYNYHGYHLVGQYCWVNGAARSPPA